MSSLGSVRERGNLIGDDHQRRDQSDASAAELQKGAIRVDLGSNTASDCVGDGGNQ